MELKREYEQDFHQWIEHHITLLRSGRFNEIDVEHLIEELEGMAGRNKHELISRLIGLIAHLLKWQFQLKQLSERWQEFDGRSWRRSIIEQRYQIAYLLESIPSLTNYLSESVNLAYPKAVNLAIDETKLPKSLFPKTCPYTVEQLIDKEFYPPSE
ncbi:hypothetical protein THII_0222 [Thioploca ingrica]|uniref:DUF29 domain-containing protein n=1 Tax=Thioploca ingrica TaxID=40754 RepID=A0A090ACP7_9GAMM|nr:hypothetical protein THII_0222 [Thioploca ingrica]